MPWPTQSELGGDRGALVGSEPRAAGWRTPARCRCPGTPLFRQDLERRLPPVCARAISSVGDHEACRSRDFTAGNSGNLSEKGGVGGDASNATAGSNTKNVRVPGDTRQP